MHDRFGPECSLRDPRQIRNLKYAVRKRLKKRLEVEGHGQIIETQGDGSYTIKYEPVGVDYALAEMTGNEISTMTEIHDSEGNPIKIILQDGETEVLHNISDGRLPCLRFKRICRFVIHSHFLHSCELFGIRSQRF